MLEREQMAKRTRAIIQTAIFLISLSVEVEAKAIHPIIDSKLKLLNKPAVKSIKSEDGDIIDCVDTLKQPAFDHPALRNHTIQRVPSFLFEETKKPISKKNESIRFGGTLYQTWHKSGSCPKGTIPIRRIRKQDLLRATSLQRFGRKNAQALYARNVTGYQINGGQLVNDTRSILSLVNRSGGVLVTVGFNYVGAQGDINLWNPYVAPDDYTTAQIWLKNGPGDAFESVEAGWAVHPKLYGDTQTRLFISWTKDAYNSTGCFDLTCQGFIQTNQHIAIGAALGPISVESGPQYQVTFAINMDTSSNWWLKAGDVVLGYWPGNLFGYLQHSSILVQWGGDVFSPHLTAPHTETDMGSGAYPDTLHGSACYVEGVRIRDYSLALKYPQRVGTLADEPYCYSAYNYIAGYGVEPVFYFGGPGRTTLCP